MSKALQVFETNTDGRDFVVGDIHGCFYMLEPLLARIGFDTSRDRLFSVGDLIDRGPDSERAVEFLDQPWFHAIRGNHEQMLLDAVSGKRRAHDLWHINGGQWFDALDDVDRRRVAERIAELPHAIEVKLADDQIAVLVHADIPDRHWSKLRKALTRSSPPKALAHSLLWLRDRSGEVLRRHGGRWPEHPVGVEGVDLIVFGHTPMPAPIASANTRWLDTGAFMGRCLSVAELSIRGEVWSLDANLDDIRSGWHVLP